MRSHSRGPFNPATTVFPVARVQRQITLTPGVSETIFIEATPEAPVFLRVIAAVVEIAASALLVKLGPVSAPEFFLLGSDTDTQVAAIGTEKRFILTANMSILAQMSGTPTAATTAARDLTLALITGANTQTVSIGGVTYTFQTTLTDVANNVLIGADVTEMALNLSRAINAGAGAGTLYGTGTVANPLASATVVAGVLTATARVAGGTGNDIIVGETLTNGSWAGGAVTLGGGGSTGGKVYLFLDV